MIRRVLFKSRVWLLRRRL